MRGGVDSCSPDNRLLGSRPSELKGHLSGGEGDERHEDPGGFAVTDVQSKENESSVMLCKELHVFRCNF